MANLFDEPEAEDRPLSVAELTEQIKELLEGNFTAVWVSGEIGNLSQPQSGHCYFTLKDEQAQIRAVMWRSVASRLRFALEDGLEVICQGGVEVYGPRGSYQLVVRKIEPKGIGALELALRKLRDRLAAEGLFDPGRKRPLPRFPRRIAFVTSPTGAAIHDFLQVLRRRWAGADVLVVPARVQGQGAAQEIAAGIAAVNRLCIPVDCLVVGRGGGSLEDLWAFNEEVVVRAIHSSRIPVISAVGHEIDVTLSDLVADVRALTPSEAAELVAPSTEELRGTLGKAGRHLVGAMRACLATAQARLDQLAGRRVFRRPEDRIHELSQRLDELAERSDRAVVRHLARLREGLEAAAARLETLSPLQVLGRGYSVTLRASDGGLVRSAGEVQTGEVLETRLGRGRVWSRVERAQHDGPSESSRS